MFEDIKKEVEKVTEEVISLSGIGKGDILVVGCSSSEILGSRIGTDSSPELGKAVFETIYRVTQKYGVHVAAQCCEHLNRALIVEREIASKDDLVNVVPQPKAGGSFATAAYHTFKDPVAVDRIVADAGIDIGGTLIGMHLRRVAVPLKLKERTIGKAIVLAARTRPRFVGGQRAVYDEKLM